MVWCPQVLSQAPQHLRSSDAISPVMVAFPPVYTCLVISHVSGMPMAVHLQEFSKMDVEHTSLGIPLLSAFRVCSKFIESVRTVALFMV